VDIAGEDQGLTVAQKGAIDDLMQGYKPGGQQASYA
jgi:hypothetical protein